MPKANFAKDLDFVNGEYDELVHALTCGEDEATAREREAEQEESRRQAQAELLDVEDYHEFRQAREAFPLLIMEPDRPQDEMTYSDYKASRAREARALQEPKLELGEMS